jgi:hypothetical protein
MYLLHLFSLPKSYERSLKKDFFFLSFPTVNLDRLQLSQGNLIQHLGVLNTEKTVREKVRQQLVRILEELDKNYAATYKKYS